MKVYTKVGDKGTTGLFGAPRVRKDDVRVVAYGEVDELNATLGLARAQGADEELAGILERLQSELFTLGSMLATPVPSHAPKAVPVLDDEDVTRLEREIDRFDEELPPLTAFVLPAGSPLAAALHVARTVCRRAERAVVTLAGKESIPQVAIVYLNRLSDHLFTLARVANHRAQVPETQWRPNR